MRVTWLNCERHVMINTLPSICCGSSLECLSQLINFKHWVWGKQKPEYELLCFLLAVGRPETWAGGGADLGRQGLACTERKAPRAGSGAGEPVAVRGQHCCSDQKDPRESSSGNPRSPGLSSPFQLLLLGAIGSHALC